MNQQPDNSSHKQHDPPQVQPLGRAEDQASSRRQFVRQLAKKAAYVAPVVITLAATKSAFATASAPPS